MEGKRKENGTMSDATKVADERPQESGPDAPGMRPHGDPLEPHVPPKGTPPEREGDRHGSRQGESPSPRRDA
jgi:hypothetical protein